MDSMAAIRRQVSTERREVRWIIRNWAVRCTLETLLAGGVTGAVYGILIALIMSGGSAPAELLGMGVVGLVLGLLFGLPLGLVNGLCLGVLTRRRFAPLRQAWHYRRSIARAAVLLNAAPIIVVTVVCLAASSPDDRRDFWSGGLVNVLPIIAIYVPLLLAYASAVIVDLRCARRYIRACGRMVSGTAPGWVYWGSAKRSRWASRPVAAAWATIPVGRRQNVRGRSLSMARRAMAGMS